MAEHEWNCPPPLGFLEEIAQSVDLYYQQHPSAEEENMQAYILVLFGHRVHGNEFQLRMCVSLMLEAYTKQCHSNLDDLQLRQLFKRCPYLLYIHFAFQWSHVLRSGVRGPNTQPTTSSVATPSVNPTNLSREPVPQLNLDDWLTDQSDNSLNLDDYFDQLNGDNESGPSQMHVVDPDSIGHLQGIIPQALPFGGPYGEPGPSTRPSASTSSMGLQDASSSTPEFSMTMGQLQQSQLMSNVLETLMESNILMAERLIFQWEADAANASEANVWPIRLIFMICRGIEHHYKQNPHSKQIQMLADVHEAHHGILYEVFHTKANWLAFLNCWREMIDKYHEHRSANGDPDTADYDKANLVWTCPYFFHIHKALYYSQRDKKY